MKWKVQPIQALTVLAVLLLIASALPSISSESFEVTGSNFTLYLTANQTMGFQHSVTAYSWYITVVTGTLNGTNTVLTMGNNHGAFTFTTQNAASINYTSNVDTIQVSMNGVLRIEGETVVLPIGVNKILWSYPIESWVDKYTNLAFGMSGIGLMIFVPIWITRKLKNDPFEVETMERIGYGIILFCIGLGLVLVWLWR